MCGIAGIFSLTQTSPGPLARAMADAIAARGPDDSGMWEDAAQGIALSHRRLSILDLSPEGHQPMLSASGRYVISFNGEIYNYRDLRAQLHTAWRGESDTEVLLAAIEQWGIEKTLPALNGMFAFAVWDTQEKTLTLARDRMGEKPLYYGWVGDQFVFASELKAFRNLPGWPPAIDRHALHAFLRYGFIPAPHSIYENISKLPAGCALQITPGQKNPHIKPYWSYAEMVKENSARRIATGERDAIDQFESIFAFAVKKRMVSDVPLGAFLSGGIDSSLTVAFMQKQAARPVKTFTIGFREKGFDEAPHAKAIAKHLGTQHTEIYLSANEAADTIPMMAQIYDEPFADSSQIPTYLVSRFAREHVTVALSGDGGDELFGGYQRYFRGPGIWNKLSLIPHPLRKLAGLWNEKLDADSAEDFYSNLLSVNCHPEKLLPGKTIAAKENPLRLKFAEWMMLQDALAYFPDDILAKVDRAAMAVSLETRTAFTDPEVMAFAWRLPLAMKIREGKGKWLLRQTLARHVPVDLFERPKAGFEMPVGEWLQGPLKPWSDDLLSQETIRKQGFLNPDAVKKLQARPHHHRKALWGVLMFQAWLNNA